MATDAVGRMNVLDRRLRRFITVDMANHPFTLYEHATNSTVSPSRSEWSGGQITPLIFTT
jgi:hypothetical protein